MNSHPSMNSHAEPLGEPSLREAVPPPPQPLEIPQSVRQELEQVYQPATAEDFHAHRLRFDRQETLSFGPWGGRGKANTNPGSHGSGPYERKDEKDGEEALMAFDIEGMDSKTLPPGWRFEDGYVVMSKPKADYWELKNGCMIRHHVVPRRTHFDPGKLSQKELEHMAVPLQKLEKIRVTVKKTSSGIQHTTDSLSDGVKEVSQKPWTGISVFQVSKEAMREMGLTANDVQKAKQVAKQKQIQAQRHLKKEDTKNDLRERDMSLADKVAFQAAKVKELKSFFDNGVWSFETTKEADPSRTLTSRIILKWSKNEDGSPRAKARLVVRGYNDVDALAGQLDTASPASTRIARTLLLSISACSQWPGWSADVSTAFLHGLPQERKLWVKLPADALRILGGDENTRMFLHKPVYGQLDAPKRWFLEDADGSEAFDGFLMSWIPVCGGSTNSMRLSRDYSFADFYVFTLMTCLDVETQLPESMRRLRRRSNRPSISGAGKKNTAFEYCGSQMHQEEDGTWVTSHRDYIHKPSRCL